MTDMFSKPESAGPYLVTAIKIWKAAPPCNRYSSATNRLSMRVRGGLRDRLRRRGPSPAQEHDAAGAPLCQGTKLAKNGIRALEAYDWRGDPDTAALPAPSGYVLSTYNHVLSTTYLAREAWASVDPAIVCPPFRSCRLWSKRNTSGWGGPGRERRRHVQGRSAAYEAAIPSATTTAHPRSSPTVMLPAPAQQPTTVQPSMPRSTCGTRALRAPRSFALRPMAASRGSSSCRSPNRRPAALAPRHDCALSHLGTIQLKRRAAAAEPAGRRAPCAACGRLASVRGLIQRYSASWRLGSP